MGEVEDEWREAESVLLDACPTDPQSATAAAAMPLMPRCLPARRSTSNRLYH